MRYSYGLGRQRRMRGLRRGKRRGSEEVGGGEIYRGIGDTTLVYDTAVWDGMACWLMF